MRLNPALLTRTFTSAFVLVAASAHAGTTDLLPIERGTYVREGVDATDPAFAAILSYDGATLSGPHSAACISRVLDFDGGARYHVSTTCFANGDGSPATPTTEKERIVVKSTTRLQFTHGEDMAVYRLVDGS